MGFAGSAQPGAVQDAGDEPSHGPPFQRVCHLGKLLAFLWRNRAMDKI